jgi:hypothetical protein
VARIGRRERTSVVHGSGQRSYPQLTCQTGAL